MDFKDIKELVKLLDKSSLSEFIMQDEEFKLTIRTQHHTQGKRVETQVISVPQPMPMPHLPPVQASPAVRMPESAPAPSAPSAAAPAAEAKSEGGDYLEIKSPIVGTFYRSASPDKPPYKKVGDNVASGEVVCIVEAMKLFNEIESEVSGKIVKVLVEDAQPVEYDQALFLVDPKG